MLEKYKIIEYVRPYLIMDNYGWLYYIRDFIVCMFS
jgi:hypothetical protein